jgi:hypothetical protein
MKDASFQKGKYKNRRDKMRLSIDASNWANRDLFYNDLQLQDKNPKIVFSGIVGTKIYWDARPSNEYRKTN